MCFARILLASSMKGLFSASVKVFHSDPSLLEIYKNKENLVSNSKYQMVTFLRILPQNYASLGFLVLFVAVSSVTTP